MIDPVQFAQNIKNAGFEIFPAATSVETVHELDCYAQSLRPRRGFDRSQAWHGWNEVDSLSNPATDIDWAFYWTQHANHPAIDRIKDTIAPYVDAVMGKNNWLWYLQDFVVLQPHTGMIRPHIDTPYRFSQFKYEPNHVGLQFMVALCDFTESNGATGYVPDTHKYIIDSSHLNNIGWEIFFRDNYRQFTAPVGSIISWHPRLLHSTMPNRTSEIRRALLLHASENSSFRKLFTVDPNINHKLR